MSFTIVRPSSLEQVKPSLEQVTPRLRIPAYEDLRHKLFSSKELYEAFFYVLNQGITNGSIDNKEYMHIYRLIEREFNSMHVTLENYVNLRSMWIFHKWADEWSIIQNSRSNLLNDELFKLYIEKAKII